MLLRLLPHIDVPQPSAGPSDEDFLSLLDEVVLPRARNLIDREPKDKYGHVISSLPDIVYEAYDYLYRFRHRPPTPSCLLRELVSPTRGAYQSAAFPDGVGAYHVDSFGIMGSWSFTGSIPTPLCIRTVDALACATAWSTTPLVQFVDTPTEDSLAGDSAIRVGTDLWSLPRSHQVKVFAEQLPQQLAGLAPQCGETELKLPGGQSSVSLVFMANARANKASDYANHRFGYRVEVLCQRLQELGIKACSQTIDNDAVLDHFLAGYRRAPRDLVVLSLYQHVPSDIVRSHQLVAEVRQVNPRVFIVIEGPATLMFKQLLSLLPVGVNMVVRGESETIVEELAQKDVRRLPEHAVRELASLACGGVFVRMGNHGFIGNTERINVDNSVRLLSPRGTGEETLYCQRGCPFCCSFCSDVIGRTGHRRAVPASDRIEWQLQRLALERAETFDSAKAASKSARIHITLLGQNELLCRKEILEWMKESTRLGLDKQFAIKIADASLLTLGREKSGHVEVDKQLIQSLARGGVSFIGIGMENLHTGILGELNKGYTADLPIRVNRELIHAGIEARYNIISNSPWSRLADVKAAHILLYVSPIFNSLWWKLGNGWGHARSPRIYSHGSSLWGSIDVKEHARSYTFQFTPRTKLAGMVHEASGFMFSELTPEYCLREEISSLKYVDERIPYISKELLYPSFYREGIWSWLKKHVSDDEVLEAMDGFRDDRSDELRDAAGVFSRYLAELAEPPHDVLRHMKASMVALESYSFSDHKAMLEAEGSLPKVLRGEMFPSFLEAESLTVPGSFEPARALDLFACSAERAQKRTASMGSRWQRAQGISASVRARVEETKRSGYHNLLAYPDRLQTRFLFVTFPLRPRSHLFDVLVDRMNRDEACVSSAVEALIREAYEFDDSEYAAWWKQFRSPRYIDIVGRSGLLCQLWQLDSWTAKRCLATAIENVGPRQPLRRLLRRFLDEVCDVQPSPNSASGER